ncbi:polysaccharide deacetylase family protein [Actinomyces weissii]|uniref:Polysaccharide deacetylase family protein n=1 Tax=Actinomyces weissii TaxID=675090 RepID=A0A7T7M838_9ACTO|nr:polysaccharide deacetylase family protein [Actinomyces weissii]QQM66620.1 polysaccharide deacetylase family protein [Actinomyces weissii]
MQRRDFMLLLAAGTAGALSACAGSDTASGAAPTSTAPAAAPTTPAAPPSPAPSPTPSPTPSRSPLWVQDGPPPLPAPQAPEGVLTGLPDSVGSTVALTIDDGADASVIDAYLDFAKDSGVRLTFFVTSSYPGWEASKDKMRPLVESGQVQLGNHTVTHAGLTSLDEAGIIAEVSGCESFLNRVYGVTGKPFVRPPYGYRNQWTDSVCASLGYTSPTMWYGSFGDSGLLTEEVLLGEARKWLLAQHIVIGHANFPTVTHLYGQIVEILRERSLLTATLDDVYLGPGHDRHV